MTSHFSSPRIISILVLAFLAAPATFPFKLTDLDLESTGDSEEREEVLLSLTKRVKRTGDLENEEGYSIKMRAFGTEYEGRMARPRRSIFSPSFQYLVIGDEEGKKMSVREATPSPKEMRSIEEGHFVDSERQGAFSVQEDEDGVRKIRGTMGMGEISVTYVGNSSDKARIRSEILENLLNKIKVLVTKTAQRTSQSTTDYKDSGQKIVLAKKKRTMRPVSVDPEILIIMDNVKYKEFKGVTKDILDYMGVFFHAINNLYASVQDPKIQFRISAITSMSTTGAQPFVENSKTNDGKYNLDKMLDSFGAWVYNNLETLPKFDLAALITGIDVYGGKQLSQSTAGLAWLKSACFLKSNGKDCKAASVSEDLGTQFDGVWHVAHELAHNLGAPHDGDGTAKDCPWKDGHIMSYEGWGTTNKYKFSRCSLNLMKEYITSSGGKCMTEVHNKQPVVPLSNKWPGDKFNMEARCKFKTKSATARVDNVRASPSQNCRSLLCKFTKPETPNAVYSSSSGPALEGSPCGKGGRCVRGECSGDKSNDADRLKIDTLCKSETGIATAYADTRRTPTENCKNVLCRFTKPEAPNAIYSMHVGPAIEGSPCGNGGRCTKETCTGEKPK